MGGPTRRKTYEQRIGSSASTREDTTNTVKIVKQLADFTDNLVKERTSRKTYVPEKIAAQVTELEQGADTLPFHSLVGHTELTPYFWIIPKDRPYPPEFDFLNPLRKNIKSVTLNNAYGKFPTVEFEMYVPDFRKVSSTINIGDTVRNSDPGRVIDYFKLGKSFNIRWGYVSNHTEWKDLRVIDRQVTFEDGTALLTVKGRFGSRLSATVSSEVFTSTYGKSAIDQIAALVDMKTDYRELLDEEYDRMFNEHTTATLAGNTLAIGTYVFSQKNDFDMFFDPEANSMKFSTPFKYEIIRRGVKPYKMTYGYPTSNISTIEIETKYPKKKGKGARKTKPLSQKPNATAIVNDKEGEAVFVVAGPIRYQTPEGEKSTTIGTYLQYAFYSLDGSNNFNESIGLEEAEKKYPPNKGFKVSYARRDDDPNYGQYLIQRIVQLPKNLTKETKTVTKAEYTLLLSEQASGKKFLSVNENVETGVNQLNVTIYTKGEPLSEGDTNREERAETEEEELSSSTIESSPKEDDDAPEGEEFEDKWVAVGGSRAHVDKVTYEYNKDKTGLLANQDVEEFKESVKALEEEARRKGDNYRVNVEDQGSLKYLYLEKSVKVPVRKDPSKPKEDGEDSKSSSESASPDPSTPAPPFKPIGQQSGLPRRTSRLKTTKVRVRLKAGDWTMRVGRIIEIVDIHKSLNGYYYVFSEEHVISTDGFHTEFECRKASKKDVNLYGRGRIRSKGSKVDPKGGTRNPKSGEEADVKAATEKDTPKTLIRDKDAERRKADLEAAKRAEAQKQKELEIQRAQASKSKRNTTLNRIL